MLGKRLDQLEVRRGRTRTNAVDHAARTVLWVAPNWSLNATSHAGRTTMDESHVLALNLALLHLLLQRLQRLSVARHDEQTRRLLVEAMNNAWPILIAASSHATRRQDAGQRRTLRAGCSMCNQADRLIDDDEIVVFEDDARLEIDRRLLLDNNLLRHIDHNHHAALHARAPRTHRSIHRHMPVLNQTLRLSPRNPTQRLMHNAVEPCTSVLRFNGDGDHATFPRSLEISVIKSPITPAVIATSARLKTGKRLISRKSVTCPCVMRSNRFEAAPPNNRPIATGNRL